MKRLGYKKFVAQGGDWGAVIVDLMGVQAAPELLGIHTNMPGIFPAEIDQAAFSGKPAPSGLSADEKTAYERVQFVYQKGIAYGYQMGLRPQTLYGIADSPVGLAAYFLDHDARSYELISRAFAGGSEGLTRDDILDNITITWLTNTALSGARLYWEYWGKGGYFNAKGVNIPVAVSVFPDELYPAPQSWTQKAYPKLIHFNKLPKGGHFAAWEQPKLFSEEVRAGFRSLRSADRKETGELLCQRLSFSSRTHAEELCRGGRCLRGVSEQRLAITGNLDEQTGGKRGFAFLTLRTCARASRTFSAGAGTHNSLRRRHASIRVYAH
jgi:pimeloyl-ACP methyl ester carboxylesterase